MEKSLNRREFIRSLSPQEVEEVLLEDAQAYRNIATKDMNSPDCSDALICTWAAVENDTERVEALIRCNLIRSYAARSHNDEEFVARMLDDVAYSSVTMEEYSREVFTELLYEAVNETRAHCEQLLHDRFATPLYAAEEDQSNQEYVSPYVQSL